ncbi:MAG: ECF-type sigma factor [Pseudomonadota bacterium]
MSDITDLLGKWRAGDQSARNKAIELLSAEISKIARRLISKEHNSVELTPTELVNESMLRLLGLSRIDWQDRAHFLAMSARAMRQTLVDLARNRSARKRDAQVVTLITFSGDQGSEDTQIDLMELDKALNELERIDPFRARIVDLKYFAGLSNVEIAALENISESTVKRSWRVARAYLSIQLQDQDA